MDERCYHIDVDGGDDDADRCGGLHDDGVDGDGFPYANSPPVAFRRLGFGGVSSLAAGMCVLLEIQEHGVNILEEAMPTSHGTVTGTVRRHHIDGRYGDRLLMIH